MIILPEKFIQNLNNEFPSEAPALLQALQSEVPVSIRVNAKKYQKEIDLEKVLWNTQGYYLKNRPVYTMDPLFHAGVYYPQEASSQAIGTIVKQIKKMFDRPIIALDLCAAPGGKTTDVVQVLDSEDILIANEVIKSRAQILLENVIKWGQPNVAVISEDSEKLAAVGVEFDIIICDAPCSGEGLFRKEPDSIQEWSEENVVLCARRQQRILDNAIELLKPGGVLIYSTCTYNTEEDEKNVSFLIEHHSLEPISIQDAAAWNVYSSGAEKGYHFFPNRTKGEGFYVAVLKKAGESDLSISKNKKSPFALPIKKEMALLEGALKDSVTGEGVWYVLNDQLRLISEPLKQWIDAFYGKLHFLNAGILAGEKDKKGWKPTHDLAMYHGLDASQFPIVELTHAQAIAYLRKDTVELPLSEDGYTLVQFQDVLLGWIKSIGNRYNNYYPTDWRIRMNGSGEESVLKY